VLNTISPNRADRVCLQGKAGHDPKVVVSLINLISSMSSPIFNLYVLLPSVPAIDLDGA
jgi:hypothetical protein